MSRFANAALGIVAVLCLLPGESPALLAETPAADRRAEQRAVAISLVKNALTALNHANLTGNYTVIRDLASPEFRSKNSAADLAATFQAIRTQKVDLSPVLVLDPTFTKTLLQPDGQLVLEGAFPTQPLAIHFQVSYVQADSGWMIHGVSVAGQPAAATTQISRPAAAAATDVVSAAPASAAPLTAATNSSLTASNAAYQRPRTAGWAPTRTAAVR